MNDAELIQRHVHGDAQAFNFLVWRWQTPIYNFCLRYSGSRDDALDLAQKTFIKCYHSLDQLNNAERFRSWLYQIALNQCRDHSRNRYYKYHVLDDSENFGDHEGNNVREVTSEMGADRSNPEWSTEQAQLQDILARALAELPDEQKTVIILKEYQDLTFHDIAEVLKESENTVKSRLYYGLRTLRKILTKWNIDKELLGYEM